ncbi:amidase [Hyphodiscus hymeniophilus]|uniref:amidase n=1 Tax=Hyphodiscus hymeniophilus TaxID=353542 RepID=A0A9P6VE58_9HELO|nr:amidase [Hyphodiscus hymeniophilus]
MDVATVLASQLSSAQIHQKVPILEVVETIPKWQKVADRRRDEILKAIPEEYKVSPHHLAASDRSKLVETCGLLSPRELSIIRLTATQLLRCIHTRIFTAVEVTRAFCKSAAIAHQATNCLAWIMFNEALADAAVLDEYLAIHDKPKGPLHGLPISVKEHIFLAGTPSTSGFVAWADHVSVTDALVVKVLRDAGAVFHVKTTDPQGLMALETESNLYGTTTNPFNAKLTPGGSSGGEAALIAMRGSLLGIGTDIGGSIRVPSAFCGIFGFKPSVARLPHGGLSGAHSGMENIIGVVGPMATCVEDMTLFCRVILETHPWLHEPSLVGLPWTPSLKGKKPLKIGIIYHDGIVCPHPPITRSLHQTAKALQAAGHTLISWDTTLHRTLIDCISKFYFLDGGKEYHDIIAAGEETASPLMKWLLDSAPSRPYSAAETWKLNELRNALQIAYAAQWNASGIDCLLCPANASVASAHGESTYWGYSSLFNILDYSSVVFPVGVVEKSDTWERFPRAGVTAGDGLGAEDERFAGYYGQGTKGPEKYRDAPVSLQLVGRRYREEEVLGMLERILEVFRK